MVGIAAFFGTVHPKNSPVLSSFERRFQMEESDFILINPEMWKNPKMRLLSFEEKAHLVSLAMFLEFKGVFPEKLIPEGGFPFSCYLKNKIIKKRNGKFYLDGNLFKTSDKKCIVVPSSLLEGGGK